jgi:CheY-like chemotaxis protein
MPRGRARAAAAAALAGLGSVRSCADPYRGMARLAADGADLVVVALRRLRRADLAFFAALRSRAPATPVLLLLPEGRRALAVEALRRGAHAYVLDPFDPDELRAVARRLLARPGGRARRSASLLSALAGEVAHAVNNPLQALLLLLEQAREAGGADADAIDRLREQGERIRDAVAVLSGYADLPPPVRSPVDLARVLREAMEGAAAQRLALPHAGSGLSRASVEADAGQVRRALDAVVRVLASRDGTASGRLRFAVRRRASSGGRFLEARLRLDGVVLPRDDWDRLRDAVVLSDERTRAALPGLALPAAVARSHGGRLHLRESRRGTVVALALPVTERS